MNDYAVIWFRTSIVGAKGAVSSGRLSGSMDTGRGTAHRRPESTGAEGGIYWVQTTSLVSGSANQVEAPLWSRTTIDERNRSPVRSSRGSCLHGTGRSLLRIRPEGLARHSPATRGRNATSQPTAPIRCRFRNVTGGSLPPQHQASCHILISLRTYSDAGGFPSHARGETIAKDGAPTAVEIARREVV